MLVLIKALAELCMVDNAVDYCSLYMCLLGPRNRANKMTLTFYID